MQDIDPYEFPVSNNIFFVLKNNHAMPLVLYKNNRICTFCHFGLMQEKGCMCTITITRLIDASTWWFPSCNFCNKSCKQEGCDFICYECGTTNKFSYK